MTETTQTVRVHTGELQVGDTVLNYGMRIRIDAIQERQDHRDCRIFWACDGTVLNLDEVREAQVVPMSWLCTDRWQDGKGWVIDRNDFWNVQGNDLPTWTVERAVADQQA